MTTEYAIGLDRDACDGVFACLVRDDRFVEGEDGLAVVDDDDAIARDDDATATARETDEGRVVVTFSDDRVADARQAARACPVDAIDVVEADDA